MINARIKFACELCGEKKSFYVMPFDEKVKSGDYIHSLTHFRLTCKECGQDYLLHFQIEKMKRKYNKKK